MVRALGVPFLGTLGVILRAKAEGHLPEAAPAFRAVIAAGLWISDELARRILTTAGESWP